MTMTGNISGSFQNSSFLEHSANNSDYVASDLLREVFFFISAFLTITGNFLVLFTVWKSSNLRKFQHRLIANLAIGDLCSGIVVLIFNSTTAQLHRWIFGDFLCTLSAFLLQMFSFQTIITLTCISIDRYYAICHALHYMTKMTKYKRRLMISVSWLYPILSCSPPFYGWGQYRLFPRMISCMMVWGPDAEDISFSAFQGLPLWLGTGIIIFCYFEIWTQARKTFITNSLRTSQRGEDQNNSLASLVKKELKVARMIIIMIITFVCTWMPFVFIRMVQGWLPFDLADKETYILGEKVTLILFTCSTFVNPIIYGMLDARFRREVTRACSCCRTN